MKMESHANHADQFEMFLVVRCDSEFFLIELDRVQRVIDNVSIYPSPFMVNGMMGLSRFGGEPLIVLSLESLASQGPPVRPARMTVIVVRVGGSDEQQGVGLAVDEALEILSLEGVDSEDLSDEVVSAPFGFGGRQVRRVNLQALSDQRHQPVGGNQPNQRSDI